MPLSRLEAMEREKARLLNEAAASDAAAKAAIARAAMLDRDMAEIERLAREYNLVFSSAAPVPVAPPVPNPIFTEVPAGRPRPPAVVSPIVNWTIGALISCYRADEKSTYSKLRFRTRENYDGLLKRITEDFGDEKLALLKKEDLQRIREKWIATGKPVMAHSLISMLRILVNYGATILEDGECVRLSFLLRNMHLASSKSRKNTQLNLEHAKAIIAKAHEMEMPSIALAQAFQFSCGLRQRDVIGEWIPQSEPGESKVRKGGKKWMRGLLWDEIDAKRVLRHVTSMQMKEITIDLNHADLVMTEINFDPWPKQGPIIVSEASGCPYEAVEFRRTWRAVARAAGVSDEIKNSESDANATFKVPVNGRVITEWKLNEGA